MTQRTNPSSSVVFAFTGKNTSSYLFLGEPINIFYGFISRFGSESQQLSWKHLSRLVSLEMACILYIHLVEEVQL